MIAIKNKKIILITPFKCGSTSLNNAFGGVNYSNVVIGPCSQYHLEHVDVHTPFIPTLFYGYKRIIVCRNPYSRAESMYSQHKVWCDHNNLPQIDIDTYIREKLLVMDINAPSLLPLCKLYEVSEWETFWKLEDIDSHAKDFEIDIPNLNVSKSKQSFTDKQKLDLRPWAEKDCELFDYEVV